MTVHVSLQIGMALLLVGCLWNDVVASTGGLICRQEEGLKPRELQCSFRIDTTKPMKDRQLKYCTDDVCVTAVASTVQPENMAFPQGQSTKSIDENDYGDTLKIGMATYRKPFASYYPSNIAQWLQQAPKTSRAEKPLEWAEWCGTLGNMHVRSYKGWYDLELAINVLQESVKLMEDYFQISSEGSMSGDDVWDSFRASVYSNLGEAYYLDPEMNHGTEALDNYEKALTIYQTLVQNQETEDDSSSTTPGHVSTRQVYAMTLAKVGSALIQLHSAESSSGYLDSIDRDLDAALSRASTTTTISNFRDGHSDDDNDNNGGHRGAKLHRASEVLSVAVEYYQEQCQKQLAPEDDFKSSNGSRISNPSTYVEACVDYATTLQYSATVESLSANYQEALDYMKRALLVYTGHREILGVSLAYVDHVLSDVYSMWYHMGSIESIGSMLVNIADTCGQLGRHEESKANYQLAMRYYSKFHVPPRPSPGGDAITMAPETKNMLDSYLSLLEEYRRGTKSNADPPLYQKDDIYEGDILYNIGTMYMYAFDDKEGMEWFEEAIRVYERTHKPGSFVKDRKYTNPRWSQIASMKASLTRIYFGQGRFEGSIRVHEESMDLFRELYGDGVNPYIQYLQEQLGVEQGIMDDSGMIGSSDTAINLENYLQSIKNATVKLETLNEEAKKKKEEL